jgi:hypothetical protein
VRTVVVGQSSVSLSLSGTPVISEAPLCASYIVGCKDRSSDIICLWADTDEMRMCAWGSNFGWV